MCQGCLCMEACRGYFLKLWRWSLDCLGEIQNVGDARAEGYLPAQESWLQEWKQSKRKKCVVVNKAKRSWRAEELFDIRCVDAEFGVCSAVFLVLLWSSTSPLRSLSSLSGWWCVSCATVCWKHAIFLFILIVQGLQLRDCLNLRRDFELWTFKQCRCCDRLWTITAQSWTECILHYDMATSL